MPTAEEILRQLATIANEQRLVAGIWHLLLVAAAAGLAAGWRPSRRLAALGLAAPCASVAILALLYRNPFNGVAFTLLASALVVSSGRLGRPPVEGGPTWTAVAGGATAVFGLVYPHFLEARSVFEYVYAAPAGVIPCPTLSIVVGLTLMADGLRSRVLALVVAAAGILYGIFGSLRLGVHIDLVLLAGAVALCVRSFGRPWKARARDRFAAAPPDG